MHIPHIPHVPAWVPWLLLVGQFGWDNGDNGNILGGLLSGVAAYLISLIQFVWSVLVAVVNYLVAVINFMWQFLLRLFQDVKNALTWVWENVIKGTLTKAVSIFARVRNWLQKVLGPIIKYIQLAKKLMDEYFNKYIKPIINTLNIFRKFLGVFRILGFKWAARLDGDIAKIEGKITEVYTTLRGYLNTAITYLDLIVDPLGILRRNPLFAALIKSAPELQNLLYAATQRPLTGSEIDSAKQDATRYTPGSLKQRYADYYSKGQLDPCAEMLRQQTIQALADYQSGANANG
jgi:hypothetical protein